MSGFSQSARGVATNWFGNGPWRSKSVLAALAVIVAGLGLWVSDIKKGPSQDETGQAAAKAPSIMPLDSGSHWNWSKPFPVYVRMGVSYVAAYYIGWLFRRLMRLILVAGALAIALLAYGKFAGWDMTHTQEQIKRGSEWTQREVTTTKDYLKGLLPSAAAGAVGMFLGFRRRSNADTSQPAA